MDKFEIFILIYVLVFYRDIGRLPKKAGMAFYKAVTAFLAALAIIHIGFITGLLPWALYDDMDVAKYNLALNAGFMFMAYIGIRYVKTKPEEFEAEAEQVTVTPAMLKEMLEFYRFHKIRTAVWITMIALFIMVKILSDYNLSTSVTVFLGVIAFFMVFFVLYRIKRLFIDNAQAFEDVPKYILDEWLARKYYTEEEQTLLKRRLVNLDLLKEKPKQDEEPSAGEENVTV